MHNNVISIDTRQPVEQPPIVAIEKPRYAAMPAHITAIPYLNQAIMWLQNKGWKAETRPEGISFRHPQIQTLKPIYFADAIEIQTTILDMVNA